MFIVIGDDFPFEAKNATRSGAPLDDATTSMSYRLRDERDRLIAEGDMAQFDDDGKTSFEATISRDDLQLYDAETDTGLRQGSTVFLDVLIDDAGVQITRSASLQTVKRVPVFQN